MDKHCNLLGQFVNYKENKVIWIRPLVFSKATQQKQKRIPRGRSSHRKCNFSVKYWQIPLLQECSWACFIKLFPWENLHFYVTSICVCNFIAYSCLIRSTRESLIMRKDKYIIPLCTNLLILVAFNNEKIFYILENEIC